MHIQNCVFFYSERKRKSAADSAFKDLLEAVKSFVCLIRIRIANIKIFIFWKIVHTRIQTTLYASLPAEDKLCLKKSAVTSVFSHFRRYYILLCLPNLKIAVFFYQSLGIYANLSKFYRLLFGWDISTSTKTLLYNVHRATSVTTPFLAEIIL